LELVAARDAQPAGVLGRELGLLAGDRVLEGGRDLDLRRGPDRFVEAEAKVAIAWRAVVGDYPVYIRVISHNVSRGLLSLRPTHASPADLLERQALVVRNGVNQLAEGHRGCQHPQLQPAPLGDLGDNPPAGAYLPRMGDRG